uniref:Sulfatase N-terminal domain-containing protein n=1 Tax=Tetranychus urticae TaxID=32264 RepID=T1JQ24_TETUR
MLNPLFFMTLILITPWCQSEKPNVLIFVVDDLGYGDLGPFGNATLPTPNLDKLASQGIKLTHHIAGASVCTPSRAALLTGRYPVRYVILFAASSAGLPPSEITFASIAKKAGYRTGLVGKWHVGLSCSSISDHCHHPNSHGFDYFYGTPMTNVKDSGEDGYSVVTSNFPNFKKLIITGICIGASIGWGFWFFLRYRKTGISISVIALMLFGGTWLFVNSLVRLNLFLMRNGELIEQPIYLPTLTDRIVQESINFIKQSSAVVNSDQHQPFLLMVTFLKVHSAHFPSKRFLGQSKHGKFGDCVMEVDYSVGRIMETLKQEKLLNNTFVYLTSDNGGHIEEVNIHGQPDGGYNGIFPGGKGHGAVEGGIRIPGIISWPSQLPEGVSYNHPTSQMDLLPTLIDLMNTTYPAEDDRELDGDSWTPWLTKANPEEYFQSRIMFHYCGVYLHGVRFAQDPSTIYKIYYYTPNYTKPAEKKCKFVCQCFGKHVIAHNPPIIYNIAIDPKEESPLPHNQSLIDYVDQQVALHQSTLDPNVESQFSLSNSIWKPWMQPCCNPPFCSCKETVENNVNDFV